MRPCGAAWPRSTIGQKLAEWVMLGSGSADPLGCTIGNAHAHGGGKAAQPALRSSPPVDLSLLRFLQHGTSRPGFDVGHLPDTWPAPRRYREDQLDICGVGLLVLGNTDCPAKITGAECLPNDAERPQPASARTQHQDAAEANPGSDWAVDLPHGDLGPCAVALQALG